MISKHGNQAIKIGFANTGPSRIMHQHPCITPHELRNSSQRVAHGICSLRPCAPQNSCIVRAGDDGVCAIFVGRDYNENMLNRFALTQRTQRVPQHRRADNFDVLLGRRSTKA